LEISEVSTGIYAIKCLANGRSYVGSAVDIARRWRTHRSDLRRGKHHCRHLQRAWNKHGEEQFEFAVIDLVLDMAQLISIEQRYLDQGKNLFNGCRTAGSTLGLKLSDETKGKLSAINRGRAVSDETARKISLALRGKPKSPTHVANAAAALRGKRLSESQRSLQIERLRKLAVERTGIPDRRKASLNELQVDEAKSMYLNGSTQAAIARKFAVSPSVICLLVNGKTLSYGSCPLEREESAKAKAKKREPISQAMRDAMRVRATGRTVAMSARLLLSEGHRRFTNDAAAHITQRVKEGESRGAIARELGVHQSTISRVVGRKRLAYGGQNANA
jgi:group I intron endonuclease